LIFIFKTLVHKPYFDRFDFSCSLPRLLFYYVSFFPSLSHFNAQTLHPPHSSALAADNYMIHMNYGQQPKSVLETYIGKSPTHLTTHLGHQLILHCPLCVSPSWRNTSHCQPVCINSRSGTQVEPTLITFPFVLHTTIERACDPSRYEPDLALNLEICDVIKEKQKNTQVISPRMQWKTKARKRCVLPRTTGRMTYRVFYSSVYLHHQ
jgi:hypothetical protein